MPTPVSPRTARRLATFAAALVVLGALASAFLYTATRSANINYYSKGSLPPELVTSWSTTRDGLGAPPTNFSGGDIFVIQNAHNMSTLAAWSISGTNSKLQIENGGTLTANNTVTLNAATTFQIDNGGTYVQNVAMAMGSNIFQGTEVFGASSNIIIQVTPTGTSTPSSPGYGNLTFNITTGATAFGWGATITNVQGNFTVQSTGSTSTVEQRLTNTGNLTLTIGGNLNISGGTLVLTNGAGVPTINLGGSYNQTGGTLNSTGSGIGTIIFTGGSSFVGFTQSGGTLTNTNINWSIASGKTVQLNNAFTLPASRSFGINAGGMLLAAATFTNNGAVNITGEFRLTDGGFATGTNFTYAGGTLGFASSGSYVVSGTPAYWPTANGPSNVTVLGGGMTLNVARTVSGLFQYAAGVGNAGNLTIGAGGTLQVNSGGFVSGSPTYAANTLLKYNTGGSYGRNGEWLATSSGAGYPHNVQVGNNTTLDAHSGGVFNGAPSQLAGNLTIDSGSVLNMGSMTQPVNVLGNVNLNGTLHLSTAAGGDIKVGVNWTRAAAGAFNPNGRAVFFNGATGNQFVIVTGGGTETFNYLVVEKTSGTLFTGIAPNATSIVVNGTSGNVFQLIGGAGNGANVGVQTGATLTLSGNGGNVLVSGGTRYIVGPGAVNFNGSKTVASASGGTLDFAANGGSTVNLSAPVDFGAGLSTVNGTLAVKSGGAVSTNPPVYASTSTLVYDNGTTYNASSEFPPTGVQNVTLLSTTQLNLNGDKTVAGTFSAGARTVGTTGPSPYSLSAASVSVSTGTLNLHNVTTTGTFSATGAAAVNVAGNWNVNGFSAGASTVNFNGTGAQSINSANVFNNLTASNDVTLGAGTTVDGTVALGSKKINAETNVLELSSAAAVTRTTGYVLGYLKKNFGGAGAFTFDVGTANGYSPVGVNVTAGAGALSVKPTQTKHPDVAGANALARYWELAGSGLTADLTFHYLAGDVAGTEADYKIFKYTGGSFTQFTPTALDTTNHTATLNGVSSFSDWTLAEASSVFGSHQFSAANYDDAETDAGTHNVTVTVRRTGGSAGAVSVHYATSDGTATAGSDYVAASGDLNWADGETADKTFDVTVNGDTSFEPDETINLTLSAPTGGSVTGSPSAATITIQNDDEATPTVSVGDVTVAEPSSGITYAVFPVTLSAASGLTTAVNFATADGTATQPDDYASATGTVTFAAGETSKTVAVIVKADALSDTPESFSLSLSSPSNATIADGTGVATITAPVGAGAVLISEFRLRGPGDPNSALVDADAPVVMGVPGRKGRRPVADTGDEDAPTPSATPVVVDVGGGGADAPPFPPETDEFIEIYNNTDADVVVADANPVTCAAQVITVGPTQACGWALVDLQGSASGNIPRFVIPAGTVIPARGHYLAASTGYSLSALAAPDQTYTPPAYSGGEADYTGLALFKTADRAQFTPGNAFDAVGFDGVATPFREGPGLLPAAGVTEDVQFSFVRNQTSGRPSDTGDNRADFTLVATTPSLLTSGTATLGAPGPENTAGPVSRNGGFAVAIPPGVASSLRDHTTVSNGSLGTLSLRRRFTNNTGQTLSKLRFRVVQVTTHNSKQLFSNQAEMRLLDAQLAGLGGTGLLATTVETPPNQTGGGGVNSGLVVSGSLTLAQPLATGQSVDVEFLLGVMKSGSYQFVVVVEGAQ